MKLQVRKERKLLDLKFEDKTNEKNEVKIIEYLQI
jgi:hypothetical protein